MTNLSEWEAAVREQMALILQDGNFTEREIQVVRQSSDYAIAVALEGERALDRIQEPVEEGAVGEVEVQGDTDHDVSESQEPVEEGAVGEVEVQGDTDHDVSELRSVAEKTSIKTLIVPLLPPQDISKPLSKHCSCSNPPDCPSSADNSNTLPQDTDCSSPADISNTSQEDDDGSLHTELDKSIESLDVKATPPDLWLVEVIGSSLALQTTSQQFAFPFNEPIAGGNSTYLEYPA